MRYVLRADANSEIGAGHVMRLLSLAEELVDRGHDVILVGTTSGLPWIDLRAEDLKVRRIPCSLDRLDKGLVLDLAPDVIVIDGYRFEPAAVAELSNELPHLVVMVDGDTLGYKAALYIDQNLDAEKSALAGYLGNRMLAGGRYALVRRELRAATMERDTWLATTPAAGRPLRVMCVLGGNDPDAIMTSVVQMLALIDLPLDVTVIASQEQHEAIQAIPLHAHTTLETVLPSAELPRMLARSDVAISATGTTAWDLLTMGIPTAFIQIAENQAFGYKAIRARGLGICLGTPADLRRNHTEAAQWLSKTWNSPSALALLGSAGRAHFDGLGAHRVAEHLAKLERGSLSTKLGWR